MNAKLPSERMPTSHPPGHHELGMAVKKQATSRVSPKVSESPGGAAATSKQLLILSKVYADAWAVGVMCANWLMWCTQVRWWASSPLLFCLLLILDLRTVLEVSVSAPAVQTGRRILKHCHTWIPKSSCTPVHVRNGGVYFHSANAHKAS